MFLRLAMIFFWKDRKTLLCMPSSRFCEVLKFKKFLLRCAFFQIFFKGEMYFPKIADVIWKMLSNTDCWFGHWVRLEQLDSNKSPYWKNLFAVQIMRGFMTSCALSFLLKPMGAIKWGTRRTRPPLFQTVGILYNMPCPPTFFSLGFVIYWFRPKLSPSHFTTKLRSCLYQMVYKTFKLWCMNDQTQLFVNLNRIHWQASGILE